MTRITANQFRTLGCLPACLVHGHLHHLGRFLWIHWRLYKVTKSHSLAARSHQVSTNISPTNVWQICVIDLYFNLDLHAFSMTFSQIYHYQSTSLSEFHLILLVNYKSLPLPGLYAVCLVIVTSGWLEPHFRSSTWNQIVTWICYFLQGVQTTSRSFQD